MYVYVALLCCVSVTSSFTFYYCLHPIDGFKFRLCENACWFFCSTGYRWTSVTILPLTHFILNARNSIQCTQNSLNERFVPSTLLCFALIWLFSSFISFYFHKMKYSVIQSRHFLLDGHFLFFNHDFLLIISDYRTNAINTLCDVLTIFAVTSSGFSIIHTSALKEETSSFGLDTKW